MRILGDRIIAQDRWLTLKGRKFVDRGGRVKEWSFVERNGGATAVVIVATTSEGALLLVKEFRIPFARNVYAFPAGLVEREENVSDAALRELAEETGFTGTVRSVGPEIASSAGLTTESMRMVYVDASSAPTKQTDLSESEEIEVVRLLPAQFPVFLREAEASGAILDAKLYTYLERVIHTGGAGE